MKKVLLTMILLMVLGSMEILAMQKRSVSPSSKAYQNSRDFEEQRRQFIRDRIKLTRKNEEEAKQVFISKIIELNKIITEKDAGIAM